MNALEMLKSDHSRVNELFSQLQESDDFEKKRDLFEMIRDELRIHSRIEETVFYPAFKNRSGFEELIDESLEEHREIYDLLDDIDGQDDEMEMDSLLDDLQEAVDQHVDVEENELFVKVQEVLNEQELLELGGELQIAKLPPAQAA